MERTIEMKCILMTILFVFYQGIAKPSVEKVVIPISGANYHICWDLWDEDEISKYYAISNFLVDSNGNIYLQDSCRTINIFNKSGLLLR